MTEPIDLGVCRIISFQWGVNRDENTKKALAAPMEFKIIASNADVLDRLPRDVNVVVNGQVVLSGKYRVEMAGNRMSIFEPRAEGKHDQKL